MQEKEETGRIETKIVTETVIETERGGGVAKTEKAGGGRAEKAEIGVEVRPSVAKTRVF